MGHGIRGVRRVGVCGRCEAMGARGVRRVGECGSCEAMGTRGVRQARRAGSCSHFKRSSSSSSKSRQTPLVVAVLPLLCTVRV